VSLRARIAVIAAAAVAVAVLATSLGLYAATARTLTSRTDRELVRLAEELTRRPRIPMSRIPGGPRTGEFGGAGGFVQVLGPDGEVRDGLGTTLPVSDEAAALAGRADRPRRFETIATPTTTVRVLTIGAEAGALQVALPVGDTVAALADLRRQLLVGGALGILLAAGLGLVVARRAVRPVDRLTDVAEEVAATQDLTRRIEVAGDDEIGRLARSFNAMLANLEQARTAQQQLVADASHELRTPLTSLRTNIEVLEHADRLPEASRGALLRDVVEQLDEFGRLVDGLVELARGAQPARAATPVRLDHVVEEVVDRLGTFARGREIRLDAAPTTVVAERDRLDRAVANLIDNALKHGVGPGEVHVADGAIVVRDHGPGIAASDLPHVFDRFYRSPAARSAPGSGLGLSIVAQVADSHGGEATADNAPDGGAAVTLRLPEAAADRATAPR
jgi:two-component system sensor histidine kinase MprB